MDVYIKYSINDLLTYSRRQLLVLANYLNKESDPIELAEYISKRLHTNFQKKLISGTGSFKVSMLGEDICNKEFILIRYIASGAFGEVHEISDTTTSSSSSTAIKISKLHIDPAEFEKEISILKKLSKLDIPGVVKFYKEGQCLLEGLNKRYYEMSLYKGSLYSFIQNCNTLTIQQLLDIAFELLYTLSLFRRHNFKHRDITLDNILYDINPTTRTYILDNGEQVLIKSRVQPIYSDFNTSVFEEYDPSDINDTNDTIAVLNIILSLAECTQEDTEKIQSLFDDISNNDDQSYSSMQSILARHFTDN